MKSLRELYRIGPGPSSSHTMGPRFAAELFQKMVPEAVSFRVTLYGSLAATGKGHRTDSAVVEILGSDCTEILMDSKTVLPFHPNALRMEAFDADRKRIADRTYYSIGGGAVSTGRPEDEAPETYPFANFSEIVRHAEKNKAPFWRAAEEFELPSVWDFLETVRLQMEKTILGGLSHSGVLPGGLSLERRAQNMASLARTQKDPRTGLLSAFALASSEENASGGIVVTAPTCGSCGILPAVLRYLRETRNFSPSELRCALASAGLIGLTIKQNASISGAEVGCQGEVGAACAMAAGAAAQLLGGSPEQIEYAAEIGLEHFLGLTCDPVMGLVQIPCIERNALAANKALTAAEYALLTDGCHRVSLDSVILAMKKTGRDLSSLYRETSEGGLARVLGSGNKNDSSAMNSGSL